MFYSAGNTRGTNKMALTDEETDPYKPLQKRRKKSTYTVYGTDTKLIKLLQIGGTHEKKEYPTHSELSQSPYQNPSLPAGTDIILSMNNTLFVLN